MIENINNTANGPNVNQLEKTLQHAKLSPFYLLHTNTCYVFI